MRAEWCRLTLFLVLAVAPRAARAQSDLDVERFKPAVTHDGFVTVEGSAVRHPDDPWEFGAFVNFQSNSLVTVRGDGEVGTQFVGTRVGVDLFASMTLLDPLAISVALPMFLAQTGDGSVSFAGLGDLRVVPKLRLLESDGVAWLAVIAELRAPTHVGDFSGGARNVVFAPRLVLDRRLWRAVRLGANVGVSLREATTFANVNAASELTYSAAASYRFGGFSGKTEVGAEVVGAVGLAEANAEELPLEVLGFLKYDPNEEWALVGGPGVGILPGYGVPTFRVFAGVRYQPTSHDRDRDGVSDREDECPDQAEDRDGVEDGDGCPEDDDDRDGIPDAEDRCPDEQEFINGFQDQDGCPDEGPARVIVEEGRIAILERVHFESGLAVIKKESFSILDQVALTMKANRKIKRVRVEGHTDETGSRELNVKLSEARAASVRDYLIAKGVRPDRLVSKGYGESRPLQSGRDPEALAANRRVEFIVEQ